jgi:hypothetical protein
MFKLKVVYRTNYIPQNGPATVHSAEKLCVDWRQRLGTGTQEINHPARQNAMPTETLQPSKGHGAFPQTGNVKLPAPACAAQQRKEPLHLVRLSRLASRFHQQVSPQRRQERAWQRTGQKPLS